jgi:hypothetical protein
MPGGGLSSTIVSSDEAGVVRHTTAICLDLDGAAPPGSNGTTMGDVGKELLTVLLSLGAPPAYLGRADQNADGQLSAGDAATLITHAFRLMHAGGSTGCPGSYCNTIPCP